MDKPMKITILSNFQKKCVKAAITAAICGLWLAAWLIVWNLSWGWIDQQVPSAKDIKPFIILVLLAYYLIQIFPSVIKEHIRSLKKI
jgi:hypothetical protein